MWFSSYKKEGSYRFGMTSLAVYSTPFCVCVTPLPFITVLTISFASISVPHYLTLYHYIMLCLYCRAFIFCAGIWRTNLSTFIRSNPPPVPREQYQSAQIIHCTQCQPRRADWLATQQKMVLLSRTEKPLQTINKKRYNME